MDARIFTFTLGSSVNANIPKSVACQNKGIYKQIPDGGDLRTRMTEYYQYFAAGVVRRDVVFSEPFPECCGLGIITTASIACYTPDSVPKLIGVVSSSIPVDRLQSS